MDHGFGHRTSAVTASSPPSTHRRPPTLRPRPVKRPTTARHKTTQDLPPPPTATGPGSTPPALPSPLASVQPPPPSTPPTRQLTLRLSQPVVEPDDDPHLRSCVEHYTYTDWAHGKRAEPLGSATIRFISPGSSSPPPGDLLDYIPTASRPLRAEVLALAAKGQLHTTDDNTVLLVHRPHTTSSSHATSTLASLRNQTSRVYVPMLMRPWVLHTCHSTTSCHLDVARTLSMLMRFYWWVGMDISTR